MAKLTAGWEANQSYEQEKRDPANLRRSHLEEKNSRPGLKNGSDGACYKDWETLEFCGSNLSASEDLVFIGFLL